jgi:hypothetical protein
MGKTNNGSGWVPQRIGGQKQLRMFKEERGQSQCEWRMPGDSEKGRPNLGPRVHAAGYRLMQCTRCDIPIRDFGVGKTDARDEMHFIGESILRQLTKRNFNDTFTSEGYAFFDHSIPTLPVQC